MTFRFLIAERGTRKLCVKYNAQWAVRMVDYFVDHGYRMRPTSEYHWNSRVDECHNKLTCYLLDDSVNVFDPEKA